MTKQLNKKGTSLVELIAVIIIMGIIAGIAVPTTIAVINRQRKNAAKSSAEAMFTSSKEVLMEAVGTGSTSIVSGDYTSGSGDAATAGYFVTIDFLVSSGELEKNPIQTAGTGQTAPSAFAFGIDSSSNKFNFGTVSGTDTLTYTVVTGSNTVKLKINDKEVTVSYGSDGSIQFAAA